MSRYSYIIVFAAAALLVPFTNPVSGQKVGTSSMQFLSVAPDARAMGMGTAYSALAEGAHALYWNPAGLAHTPTYNLAIDRVDWFLDAAHYAVGYGMSLGNFGQLGAHFYMAQMGEFQETRVDQLGFVDRGGATVYNPGLTGNTFSLNSWVLGITYARNFTDQFAAGLTAKMAREDLWVASGEAFLFDFGMSYQTGYRSLRVGASVQNFGAPVTFAEEAYPVPLLFRIGGAMDIIGSAGLVPLHETSRLTATFDLIQPNDYDQQWAAGVEYAFMERFFMRGGYQYNYDIADLSFGGGLQWPVGATALGVDYAYSMMTEAFGAIHRMGLTITHR